MSLDPADTIEPTETLDFIAGWLASDPARLCRPALGPAHRRQAY